MNKERKATANKGFSLVELIIVIAIMAVLIAVLAPQYMKYVERSRNSTDSSNCTAMESAVQVWGAETDIPSTKHAFVTDATGSKITVSSTGTVCSGTNQEALEDALENAGIPDDTVCVSRTKFTQYVITVKVASNGVVSISNSINP